MYIRWKRSNFQFGFFDVDSFLIQFIGHSFDIFEMGVRAQLKVFMIELLYGTFLLFFLLADLDDVFDVLNQM